MKRHKLLPLILLTLIFIYFYWRFTQGFDTPKKKYWTQDKKDSWIEKIVSSSKYLPDIDSLDAYIIGECATEKIIDSFTYEQIMKIEELEIDSQKIILAPIVIKCMFPEGFQNIYTTISDTSQIGLKPNDFNGYWNANKIDYRRIESVLEQAIKTDKQDYIERLTPESSKLYYRQYLFYLNKDNDSLAFINALCELLNAPYDSCGVVINRPMDWRNKFIHVNDGGDCYWSIVVNMSKNNYDNFFVNGY